MLPELGQIALILSLLLALLLGLLPMIGAHRNDAALMATARPLAFAQLLFIALAYAVLTHAFVVHDFSVAYVAKNSNTLLPAIYQVPAVWGTGDSRSCARSSSARASWSHCAPRAMKKTAA